MDGLRIRFDLIAADGLRLIDGNQVARAGIALTSVDRRFPRPGK